MPKFALILYDPHGIFASILMCKSMDQVRAAYFAYQSLIDTGYTAFTFKLLEV